MPDPVVPSVDRQSDDVRAAQRPMSAARELAVVIAAAVAMTAVMTWPLAPRIARLSRADMADGRFSIWNVAWVARTIVVDPLHVFDANIFYPRTKTLAYSENNLGAGILALPAYWATHNPIVAHNFVALLSFVLSAAGTYYLVRHLTADRNAAIVSAVCFAFTPYVFAHSAHIQLMMTAGLPFSLWCFHRLTDRVTAVRGATLGAVMAAQAICCGYYGVFAILMVGYAAVVVASIRRWWFDRRYWGSLAVGAAVAVVLVLPAFLPYITLQRVEGFRRGLEQAQLFSSRWSDYLASAAHAHAWLLRHLPRWVEVGFPGITASVAGVSGLWLARRRERGSEVVAIYGGLAVLAGWASFGPVGALYTALYRLVPFFTWLRAPARFVVIVSLCLSVLAGFAFSQLIRRFRRPAAAAVCMGLLAAAELKGPSPQRDFGELFGPAYRTLATLPPGPLIELPFYAGVGSFPLHTRYMLASTSHWMPLVNGYSDYIPPDFRANAVTLEAFPSVSSLQLLQPMHVRYAMVHLNGYNAGHRREVEERLQQLATFFRVLYADEGTRLYEIVAYPN